MTPTILFMLLANPEGHGQRHDANGKPIHTGTKRILSERDLWLRAAVFNQALIASDIKAEKKKKKSFQLI